MQAEMQLEILRAQLEQKEEKITWFMERIKLLSPTPDLTDSVPNTQVLSPIVGSPPVTSQTSRSPSIQVPMSDDEISSSFSVKTHIQSSYSEVLQTPTPIPLPVRRIPTPSIGRSR